MGIADRFNRYLEEQGNGAPKPKQAVKAPKVEPPMKDEAEKQEATKPVFFTEPTVQGDVKQMVVDERGADILEPSVEERAPDADEDDLDAALDSLGADGVPVPEAAAPEDEVAEPEEATPEEEVAEPEEEPAVPEEAAPEEEPAGLDDPASVLDAMEGDDFESELDSIGGDEPVPVKDSEKDTVNLKNGAAGKAVEPPGADPLADAESVFDAIEGLEDEPEIRTAPVPGEDSIPDATPSLVDAMELEDEPEPPAQPPPVAPDAAAMRERALFAGLETADGPVGPVELGTPAMELPIVTPPPLPPKKEGKLMGTLRYYSYELGTLAQGLAVAGLSFLEPIKSSLGSMQASAAAVYAAFSAGVALGSVIAKNAMKSKKEAQPAKQDTNEVSTSQIESAEMVSLEDELLSGEDTKDEIARPRRAEPRHELTRLSRER